jgi:hypothetical protein
MLPKGIRPVNRKSQTKKRVRKRVRASGINGTARSEIISIPPKVHFPSLRDFINVKLPGHKSGASRQCNHISYCVPLDPTCKARLAGHLPVKEPGEMEFPCPFLFNS